MGTLVLAGAGHAHMTVMDRIPEFVAAGHAVTVIGPGPRHYYSGMGPGLLGGSYRAEEISFPVESMVTQRGGSFIRGKVMRIDAHKRRVLLESGQEVPYDALSCNLGSGVPDAVCESGSQDVYSVKPIENLLAARQRILELAAARVVRVGVCGGGAAALEVAGNAWAAGREEGRKGCRVQVFTGSGFLRHMPQRVQELAQQSLDKRGIEVVQGSYVHRVRTGQLQLQNGSVHDQDVIFLALGVKPSRVFAASDLPTGKDGGLIVNRYLQCVAWPEIFGGGDCIWFEPQPLDKVGVYAVRQNPVLLHNLRAFLEGRSLQAFSPGGSYLLIFKVGGGTGVLHTNGLAFNGRLAFRIKDYIDRRFIRTFMPS